MQKERLPKMKITKDEIKIKRKLILSKAKKKTTISKGDKRPTDSTRTCCVCGSKLTRLSLVTNKVTTIREHYSLVIDDLMKVHMCKNISTCYSEYDKRGELE